MYDMKVRAQEGMPKHATKEHTYVCLWTVNENMLSAKKLDHIFVYIHTAFSYSHFMVFNSDYSVQSVFGIKNHALECRLPEFVISHHHHRLDG